MGQLQYLYFLKNHFAKDQNRVVNTRVCVCVSKISRFCIWERKRVCHFRFTWLRSIPLCIRSTSISNTSVFPPKFIETIIQIFATSITQLAGRVKQLYNDIYPQSIRVRARNPFLLERHWINPIAFI
jgi:hypothetical protein